MNTGTFKIVNGKIITPDKIIEGGSILVSNGMITAVSEKNIEAKDAVEIDAGGNYVSPGFIDIHVHGGGGHDFMDGHEKAFLEIAATHARYGTTSMLPTTLTSSKDELFHTLEVYETAEKNNVDGAWFLGLHLEGPYLNVKQCGAQDPKYIRNPDPAEYKEVLAATRFIKRWSAAPELPGAIEFGRYLTGKGILVAMAHTDAIYEEALEAFENGYTLATHFYSAMSGVVRRNAHRYAGVVEAGYLIDAMDVEIIADGVHLPAPLLKLVYKIKGANRTALITDAMRGAGMPEGDSVLGNIDTGLKVIIEDGVAKLPDRSSFAGSVATTDRLVRNMVNMAEVSLLDAVKMMTLTPARIIKADHLTGSLAAGKLADIVFFDGNINVQMTMVKGKIVYKKEP
ncbi:N-acetylglucosamine-6-phosphate deacetylase [Ferruginibacter paludis]|uniref:N-acetylglucosamine-6-phosphate deacetylase n=1 Tax=Ferruginibacter paludis TaxID=1310417 RepID=UPI0025B52664|nr:N-acetylglucosamine-6-phosphate deacetylase [Ferruginibacter paludis]MDN3656813.1 N-acetylglucosamine-6-phosphate deacetylase [Ferruginibacter paludis]